MMTEGKQGTFGFQSCFRREVVGRFDGGTITSDAGGLLLREAEGAVGILRRFARCFTDHRDAELIEHTVEQLVSQRVYGLALGYEDLNDHDELRHDPPLAVLAGKGDATGQDRRRKRDRGKALAGKSALNRLELTPVRVDEASRHKKITVNRRAVDDFVIDVFLQGHSTPPTRIVLDLDATDDRLHGHQSGRFFHGYYMNYCYLPRYISCGDHPLCSRLRPWDIDASAGSVKELDRIVSRIRQAWPDVQIVIRGDSGFCREPIMFWCEANRGDYVVDPFEAEKTIPSPTHTPTVRADPTDPLEKPQESPRISAITTTPTQSLPMRHSNSSMNPLKNRSHTDPVRNAG